MNPKPLSNYATNIDILVYSTYHCIHGLFLMTADSATIKTFRGLLRRYADLYCAKFEQPLR